MEAITAWIIYLGLQFLELCNGFPVTSPSDGGPPAMELGALAPALIAALFLLTMVTLLAGCACCQRERYTRTTHPSSTYHPEVIDMPASVRVGQSAAVPVDTGIVNPIVDREFTIFGPLAVSTSRPSPERVPEPQISPQQPFRPPDNGNNYPQFEDNNNGPISEQELENIVNNNAENYIVSEYENRNLNANRMLEERDDDVLIQPSFSRNISPPTAAPRNNISEASPLDRLDQHKDWFDNPRGDFPRNQLQYLQEIGRGWFGRIVESEAINLPLPSAECATSFDNQTPPVTKVAVKILDENVSVKEKCTFLNECRVYRDLTHENILSMLGRNLTQDPWLILFEFCPLGDLKQFLLNNKSKMSSLEQQGIPLKFQCEIASAVAYLHSREILHPDIACHSCMVADDLTARLGDYGDSERRHPNDYYRASDEKVTPLRWLPPESLTHKIAQEGNVWSLGVFLWESSSWGVLPYESFTDEDVISNVMCVDGTKLPQPAPFTDYTVYMYHIMQGCWQYDPSSRWTAHQVFSHLCNVYKTCYETTRGHSEDDPVMRNFNARWQNLKPNSIPKVDNGLPYSIPSSAEDLDYYDLKFPHSSGRSVASQDSIDKIDAQFIYKTDATASADTIETFRDKIKSDSLTNLHGSFESVRNPKLSEKVLSDLENMPVLNFQDTQDSLESSTVSDSLVRDRLFSSTSTEQTSKPVFAYRESSQVAPWLQDVALTSQEDMSYIKTVSDVISDLDNMLNSEKTSSSESSHQTSPSRDVANNAESANSRGKLIKSDSSENDGLDRTVTGLAPDAILISESVINNSQRVPEFDAVNSQDYYPTLDFRLVKLQDKPDDCDSIHPIFQTKCPGNGQDYDSLQDTSYSPEASKNNEKAKAAEEAWGSRRQCSSGSETEDEIWKKRIEMGAITEKIKLKSKSVTDFMVLTHIDMDFTDLESEDASYTSLDNRTLFSLEKKYRKSQSDSPKKDSSLPTEEYLSFPRISSNSLLNHNAKPGLDMYKLKKSLWNMTLKNLRPTKSMNDLTTPQAKSVASVKELLVFKSGMDSFLGKSKSVSLSDRPTAEAFDLSPGDANSQDCLRTPDSDTLINCPSIQTDNNSLLQYSDTDRLFQTPSNSTDTSTKLSTDKLIPETLENLKDTEDAIDRILSYPAENLQGINYDSSKATLDSKAIDSLPSESETLQFSCNFTDINADIYSDKTDHPDDVGVSTYKSFADDAEDTTCYFNLPGDTMFSSPFVGSKFSSMGSGNFVNFLTPLESLEKIKQDEMTIDPAEEEHLKFSSNFTDINTNLNQNVNPVFKPLSNETWESTVYLSPPDGTSNALIANEKSHSATDKNNIDSTLVASLHGEDVHTPRHDLKKTESDSVSSMQHIKDLQSPFNLFKIGDDNVTTSTPVLNEIHEDDIKLNDSVKVDTAVDDIKNETVEPDIHEKSNAIEITNDFIKNEVYYIANNSKAMPVVDSIEQVDDSVAFVEDFTHFNQSDDSKVIESKRKTVIPAFDDLPLPSDKSSVVEKVVDIVVAVNEIVPHDKTDDSKINSKTLECLPNDIKDEIVAIEDISLICSVAEVNSVATEPELNSYVDELISRVQNEDFDRSIVEPVSSMIQNDPIVNIKVGNHLLGDIQDIDESFILGSENISSGIDENEPKEDAHNESDDSRISNISIATVISNVDDGNQTVDEITEDIEFNPSHQFIINEAFNSNVSSGIMKVDSVVEARNDLFDIQNNIYQDTHKDNGILSNQSDDSKIVTPGNKIDQVLPEVELNIVNKCDDSRIIENMSKLPKEIIEENTESIGCDSQTIVEIQTTNVKVNDINYADIDTEPLPLAQQIREIKQNEINNLTSKLAMAENENNLNIEHSSSPITTEENEIEETSTDDDISSSHGHDSGLPTQINNNSSINYEATPLDDDLIESLDVEFMKLDMETETAEKVLRNDFVSPDPQIMKTELKTGHSTGWFLHPKLEPLDGLENGSLFNMPIKNARVTELSGSVSASNTGSTESLSENSTSDRYSLDVDSVEALRNELELKLPLAQKIGQICHENIAEVLPPQESLEEAEISATTSDVITDIDSTNENAKSPITDDFMDDNDIPKNVPPQAIKNELMIHYNLYGVVPLSPILEETWSDFNETDKDSSGKNVKYADEDVEDQEAAFNRLLIAYNNSMGGAPLDMNISQTSSQSYTSSDVNSSIDSDICGQATTSFQWHQPVEMVMGCTENPNMSALSDLCPDTLLSHPHKNLKDSPSADMAPQEFDSLEMETEIENVKDKVNTSDSIVSMASERFILNEEESPLKENFNAIVDISGLSNNSNANNENNFDKPISPVEIPPVDEIKSNIKESTNNTVSDLTDDLSNISNISTPTFVSDINTWNDSETYVKTTSDDQSETDNTLSASDNILQKTFIIEDKKCMVNDESMDFNHLVEELPEDFVDISNNVSPLPCEISKPDASPVDQPETTVSDSQSSDITKKSFDIGSVVSHATQIPNSLYNVAVKLPDDTTTDTSNLSLPSMPTMNSLNESEACVTPMSAHNSLFDEQFSTEVQKFDDESNNCTIESSLSIPKESNESNLSSENVIKQSSNLDSTTSANREQITPFWTNPIITATHNFLSSEISMAPFVQTKFDSNITDDNFSQSSHVDPKNELKESVLVDNDERAVSNSSLNSQSNSLTHMTSSPNELLDISKMSFHSDVSNIITSNLDLQTSHLDSVKSVIKDNVVERIHASDTIVDSVSPEFAIPEVPEESNIGVLGKDIRNNIPLIVADAKTSIESILIDETMSSENLTNSYNVPPYSPSSDTQQGKDIGNNTPLIVADAKTSIENILIEETTSSENLINSSNIPPYSPSSDTQQGNDMGNRNDGFLSENCDLKIDLFSYTSDTNLNEKSSVDTATDLFKQPNRPFASTPDAEPVMKDSFEPSSKTSREGGESIDVLIDTQFEFLDCLESPIINEEKSKDEFRKIDSGKGDYDQTAELAQNSTDVQPPEISSPDLSQIYFSGPTNDDIMSTSFNESNSSTDDMAQSYQSLPNVHLKKLEDMNFLAPERLKEWESESDDSSSGEFVWKEGDREQPLSETSISHFQSHSTPQKQVRQSSSLDFDTIPEEMVSPSAESGGGSGDDEEVEFVPSSWDYLATPSKSALKSADTSQSEGRKRVVFKKQKYHCVYEYPREISDNEAESPQLPDYSPYSDWQNFGLQDLNFDNHIGSHHDDLNFTYTIDNPVSDDDFFISSSTRPFENFSLLSTSSQFFPGQHLSLLDNPQQKRGDIDNFEALQNALGLNGPDPTEKTQSDVLKSSDFITPDSGTEDVTPASLLDYDFKHQFLGDEPSLDTSSSTVLNNLSSETDGLDNNHTDALTEQDISITAANKCSSLPVRQFCGTSLILPERGSPSGSLTPSTPSPSASGQSGHSSGSTSPLPPPSGTLGGLRHTRDKLKLDLPPSPLARNSPNVLTSGKNANKDIKIFDFKNVETPHLHELHKSLTENFSDPRKFTVTSVPEPYPNLINAPVTNKPVEIPENVTSQILTEVIKDPISSSERLIASEKNHVDNDTAVKDSVSLGNVNVSVKELKDVLTVLSEPISTETIESVDSKSDIDNTQFETATLQKAVVPLSVEENARKVILEPVKGEGTLLDSGDEDSGIGSSAYATLERKIDSKNADLIKSSIIEKQVN